MRKAKNKIINLALLCCVLQITLTANSCSVPNLETPSCTAGRDVVKRFYSFHFGNDMRPSPENLESRASFLTSGLKSSLAASTDETRDYFTGTDNYPKAFRVGQCTSLEDNQATLQVLLLWHDETRDAQRVVHVETKLVDSKWLIDKVTN